MTSDVTCPACALATLEPFLELPRVPVLSTAFHDSAAAARDAPRGELSLAVCRRCALVWNVRFDPSIVEYRRDYENSQLFSPTFRQFATELAARLAETYRLSGRTVVEVGSGKGEFLQILSQQGDCDGLGFDPTFDGEVSSDRIRVVREYYDRSTAEAVAAALVIARHVLEHVADPLGFLKTIREASGEATPLYVEVPNAESVFGDDGMWDLLYQHVAYFSRPALEAVTHRAGYQVVHVRASFHGQFLSVEGLPSTASETWEPDPAAVADACVRVDTFAARLCRRLAAWQQRLADHPAGEVVLWGAGAKGVAFLNLLDAPGTVDRVVDLNPRKVGRHVAGTGHRIEAPQDLDPRRVGTVLVTNPAYGDEIRQQLARMGATAHVESV